MKQVIIILLLICNELVILGQAKDTICNIINLDQYSYNSFWGGKLAAILKEDIYFDTEWQGATPLQKRRFAESTEGKERLKMLKNEKEHLLSSTCEVTFPIEINTQYNITQKRLYVYFDDRIAGVEYIFSCKSNIKLNQHGLDGGLIIIPCEEEIALEIEDHVEDCRLSFFFRITPKDILKYEPGVFVGEAKPVIEIMILKIAIINKATGERYLEL